MKDFFLWILVFIVLVFLVKSTGCRSTTTNEPKSDIIRKSDGSIVFSEEAPTLPVTVAVMNDSVEKSFKDLINFRPNTVPMQFNDSNDMYEPGDEKQPFFSEAYLYVLLGKEDARTLLALLERTTKICNVDLQDLYQ